MKILSWNLKSFVSGVLNQTEGLTVLEAVMSEFDLIVVYEVPLSANGNAAVGNLVVQLSIVPPGAAPGVAPVYTSFLEQSGGVEKENDQVAVIWKTNTTTVVNTTTTRRGNNYSGRAPVYFNVTELATGKVREFCAWHAPQPGAAEIIAQGWQHILYNSEDNNSTHLTTIILGDFNADLSVPQLKRKRGNFFQKQITKGATTLKSGVSQSYTTTQEYRTNNRYDQFFVDTSKVQPVNSVGIYDVLDRLVNKKAPLTNATLARYDTAKKAYDFYSSHISDHLPVALVVNL